MSVASSEIERLVDLLDTGIVLSIGVRLMKLTNVTTYNGGPVGQEGGIF